MTGKASIMNTKSKLRQSWPLLMASQDFKEKFLDLKEKNRHTPDILQLEKYRGHLLFVYGTLKSGHTRNTWFLDQGAKYVAQAMTTHPYSMFVYENRKDKFPILLPIYGGYDRGNVLGQLYIVSPKTLMELDELERNGVLFKRMKMNLQILNKPHHKDYQQFATLYAWAYMGINKEWLPLIPLQDIVPLKQCKLYADSERNHYLNFTTCNA